jgi:hypothetical protein
MFHLFFFFLSQLRKKHYGAGNGWIPVGTLLFYSNNFHFIILYFKLACPQFGIYEHFQIQKNKPVPVQYRVPIKPTVNIQKKINRYLYSVQYSTY